MKNADATAMTAVAVQPMIVQLRQMRNLPITSRRVAMSISSANDRHRQDSVDDREGSRIPRIRVPHQIAAGGPDIARYLPRAFKPRNN